jgi:hypothetical protein
VANLPAPFQRATPDLMRAAVSPTAAALTAAGVAIGLGDHSVILAVVLAAGGWSARMAGALVQRARRRRELRRRPPRLDPWSVPEPWRQLVADAESVRQRFDQILASWPSGPTRDELERLQSQVWAHVAEVGVVAQRGAAADGWNGATFPPKRADELRAELSRLQREKVRYAGSERAAAAGTREAALAAELRDLHHRDEMARAVQDQLRAAVGRLESAVVGLVVVEPAPMAEADDAGQVTRALDDLSDRLSTLRTALTETAGPGIADGNPTP